MPEIIDLLQDAASEHSDVASDESPIAVTVGMTKKQALDLYTSHLLSTWNARTYEFAAIIFTASAYPDTLVAPAIRVAIDNGFRGIVTTLASICLSTYLGRWIDTSPNRLKTLLTTIAFNRASVISASILWFFITTGQNAAVHERSVSLEESLPSPIKNGMFAVVLALGIFEKLSGSANLMSMERDWVTTVAAPDGHAYDLTRLNAAMRRIDLGCKLIAPVLTSVITSAVGLRYGICTIGGMSAISWGIEVWSARNVWNENSSLQVPKTRHAEQSLTTQRSVDSATSTIPMALMRRQKFFTKAKTTMKAFKQDILKFFSTPIWIPSVALSMLHISVLTYNASFISYLLSAGLSLNLIAFARASGGVIEISSTVVAPVGVSYLGKHRRRHGHDVDDEEAEGALLEQEQNYTSRVCNVETGLERLGLWGITWQFLSLIPVVLALWSISSDPTLSKLSPLLARLFAFTESTPKYFVYFALFTFLSLSRLGLWVFDLTTQQLTQTMVPAASRSSFAGVENSITNIFELGQWVVAIILSEPEQFKWLALGSLLCVWLSMVIYAGWVRRMRGHLLHWENMGKCKSLLGGSHR